MIMPGLMDLTEFELLEIEQWIERRAVRIESYLDAARKAAVRDPTVPDMVTELRILGEQIPRLVEQVRRTRT